MDRRSRREEPLRARRLGGRVGDTVAAIPERDKERTAEFRSRDDDVTSTAR